MVLDRRLRTTMHDRIRSVLCSSALQPATRHDRKNPFDKAAADGAGGAMTCLTPANCMAYRSLRRIICRFHVRHGRKRPQRYLPAQQFHANADRLSAAALRAAFQSGFDLASQSRENLALERFPVQRPVADPLPLGQHRIGRLQQVFPDQLTGVFPIDDRLKIPPQMSSTQLPTLRGQTHNASIDRLLNRNSPLNNAKVACKRGPYSCWASRGSSPCVLAQQQRQVKRCNR